MIDALVVADSMSPRGARITTIEATIPKFILAELNKHRIISNNAQSTRAMPLAKQIELVENDPFIPVFWGLNQSGMSASVSHDDPELMLTLWLDARDSAVRHARLFLEQNIHKQTAGRLLEPFSWCKVVLTATTWTNFLTLRQAANAQPEIQELARLVKRSLEDSRPIMRPYGEWHAPYVTDDERVSHSKDVAALSAARCARVSYGRQNESKGFVADMERFSSLVADKHWSAMEHQAESMELLSGAGFKNLTGWKNLRSNFENEHDASL